MCTIRRMTRAAKYLTIVLLLLMFGCRKQPESVELERDNFSDFERNAFRITELEIECFVDKMLPIGGHGWLYRYCFAINDTTKIKTIIGCIGNAERPRLARKHIRREIFLKHAETVYQANLEVTAGVVYGNWWESGELFENLKLWHMIEDRSWEGPDRPFPEGIACVVQATDADYPWEGPAPQLSVIPDAVLTRDVFRKLDDSEIVRIYIPCWVDKYAPDGEKTEYNYIYTIDDPQKVKEILRNIREGRQTEYLRKRVRYRIWFKSKKAFYTTRLWWDEKVVYGEWWESAELLEKFKQWNLLEDIAKADPNRDPPT